MKRINEFKHIGFLAVLVAFGLGASWNVAEAAPCRACQKILALKDEYRKSQDEKGSAHDEVAHKINAVIATVKRQADGGVEPPVVDAIIEIMRVDKDRWFRQLFVEMNLSLFKDNRELFSKRLKKLPAREAKEISEDIDIKFAEMEFGQDRKEVLPKSSGK